MNKRISSRLIIHFILLSLKKNESSFDSLCKKYEEENEWGEAEKKFIRNVVLTTMREELIIQDILKKYKSKKKSSINEYILLISAVCQIIFLGSKEYGVINESVEIAKKNKLANPSFVNAILRKICLDKNDLLKNEPKFDLLPSWFKENARDWNDNTKKQFLQTIRQIPDLHIVFKNTFRKNLFEHPHTETTEKSLIVKDFSKIQNLPNYKKGIWWVQDYSAMLPIYLLGNITNKNIIDMCAAPGGKLFQFLSMENNITAYEINQTRANILSLNLERLKFKLNINIEDVMNNDQDNSFDIVLLDAPCSSVGTIRRNPEIIFRNNHFDIKHYVDIQKKLLYKASKLVKKNGIILYMVCSFFKKETNNQINNFLKKNKNFSIVPFVNDNLEKDIISKKGFFKTIPRNINNKYSIDGFFAARLIKND